jgi:hypothetical protein
MSLGAQVSSHRRECLGDEPQPKPGCVFRKLRFGSEIRIDEALGAEAIPDR